MVYECIPNFSEGRNQELIAGLVDVIGAAGVPVRNIHADADYNRTVLTFLGSPDRIAEASFNTIALAADRIDMTRHSGEHPRLGATDVCPWVALDPNQEEQCIADLRALAVRVAHELDLCVYLYGKAALRPDRRRLADIRRGEFEAWYHGLGVDARWHPDLGSKVPRACGPVVLGVRSLMIAINYVLDSQDLGTAKAIARRIRQPDIVQARGFRIHENVHVSCNLLAYRVRNPRKVFDQVRHWARRSGTDVLLTEIVGLLPGDALAEGDVEAMRVTPFHERMLLDFWIPAGTG